MSLAEWQPILNLPGVRFVSLQYGDRSQEIAAMRAMGVDIITDSTVDPLINMDRAAAQIAAMDGVICINNSVAATAAALGKPVWTLLAIHPEWRVGFQGDTTPWYPTMKIFRQRRHSEWAPVIADVAVALQDVLSKGQGF